MSQDVLDAARRARAASHGLALATRAQKDGALLAMAEALLARQDEVLDANAEDVARAEAAVSSASAPRSGSAPRSCTPVGRWGCRR